MNIGLILKRVGYCIDILPGLKARVFYLALAPRRVDISEAAATLALVLSWPIRPFFVSDCPPATNIFLVD